VKLNSEPVRAAFPRLAGNRGEGLFYSVLRWISGGMRVRCSEEASERAVGLLNCVILELVIGEVGSVRRVGNLRRDGQVAQAVSL